MEPRLHYGTITEAIQQLRERGYTEDFNLEENCIVCRAQKLSPAEFEIMDVYRYEGNSDPDDEAAVYAIESKSGLKGILVTSYGAYTDEMSAELLEKLKRPRK
jgi:hypothetical protein